MVNVVIAIVNVIEGIEWAVEEPKENYLRMSTMRHRSLAWARLVMNHVMTSLRGGVRSVLALSKIEKNNEFGQLWVYDVVVYLEDLEDS